MLDTVSNLLQKAEEFIQLGQAELAFQVNEAILLAHPNHPEANYNMGLLAIGSGRTQAGLTF